MVTWTAQKTWFFKLTQRTFPFPTTLKKLFKVQKPKPNKAWAT